MTEFKITKLEVPPLQAGHNDRNIARAIIDLGVVRIPASLDMRGELTIQNVDDHDLFRAIRRALRQATLDQLTRDWAPPPFDEAVDPRPDRHAR